MENELDRFQKILRDQQERTRLQFEKLKRENPLLDFSCGCDSIIAYVPKIYGHYPQCFKRKEAQCSEAVREQIQASLKAAPFVFITA